MAKRKKVKNQYCKHCGAPVLRIRTSDGTWLNLDGEPVWIIKHGKLDTFITIDGNYVFGSLAGDACEDPDVLEAYICHRIVCQNNMFIQKNK